MLRKTIYQKISIIVAVMLLLSMALVTAPAQAAAFTPRYTAPERSNGYYYANNPFYQAGYGMPNCTAYSYGRAWEILGYQPNLSRGNAGQWWNYNKNGGYYAYGSTPKLGAIAVWDKWDSNQGHVAVVEAINGNRVTISESHWRSVNFDTRTCNANMSDYLTGMRFLGYIYIGDFDSKPDPPKIPHVDLGTDFYAMIINNAPHKMVTSDMNAGCDVSIRTETGRANQIWYFQRDSDGSYRITNQGDNLVLDVYNMGTTDGTPVKVANNNDSNAQRWFIQEYDGAYNLRSRCSDLVLDVHDGSYNDGATLQMFTRNGTDAQKFSIFKVHGDPYDLGTNFCARIGSQSPGMYLTNNGAMNVTLNKETGKTDQIWRFEHQVDGTYKIISCYDNNVLDADNSGTINGTNLKLYWSNDQDAQRWYLYNVAHKYQIKAKYTYLMVDITNGAFKEGNNVQLYSPTWTEAQWFNIEKLPNAGVSTISVNTGTAFTPTTFNWTKTADTDHYNLRIYKGKKWESDPYVNVWDIKETSCSVNLPAGTYEAYIDSCNSYSTTMSSNTVTFTVDNGSVSGIGYDFYANIQTDDGNYNIANVDSDVKIAKRNDAAANQLWHFKQLYDGSYTIISCLDGKAIDLDNYEDKDGSNVHMISYNGSEAQKWKLYDNKEGRYYLQPSSSKTRVMDIKDGNLSDSGVVQIWSLNYSKAQKYNIHKVNVVETIALDSPVTKMNVGETYQLKAIIKPDDAVDKELMWSSDNDKILKVDQKGKITAVGAGKAIITATSATGKSVSCVVEVTGDMIKGDLNGNGKVDLMDARKAKQTAMRQIELSETELKAADLNGDGRVDVMEARKIKQAAMKQVEL